MRILIEEHQYAVSEVKDILYGIDALENVEGMVSIHYVGYYYNALLGDCVFILPKVLLKDVNGAELVFGKYRPEDILHLENQNRSKKMKKISSTNLQFGFTVQSWSLSKTSAMIQA